MGLDIDLNLTNEECDKDNVPCASENIIDCEIHEEREKELEPHSGMEFDSHQEAYSFYLKYAKSIGFSASTKNSRRSKASGEFIDVKFACTRYGVKREFDALNPRPCLKIDCKAFLHVKRRHDGKWFIHDFIKEHNHELFPSHTHYLSCHRSITPTIKQDINTLHAVGVKTSKIFAAMAKQNGGYENIGFLEKDIRNHFDKERRLELASGDAQGMLEHFIHMQEENANFFYALDLDEEQRLRNVFWVDAKGREDFKIFGDVVSFDTTYITNKYKMPFAPFVGVNNHFQTTLLGCALLANETTSTFIWLMQTWIRAMGGKSPTAILTDQDRAMKAVISEVFPNTRHRFCLWHILRKVPEKLGHVIRKYENFMGMFNSCIYNSWTEDEFEKKWGNMIERFELTENEWIEGLFEDRKYWVPIYMRGTFFARMSTTQRSESINSFFDKYVSKKISLKEFVEQYMVALQDRDEKAAYADFCTLYKKPALKSPSPFEKQMSVVYTLEVFKKFQVEVLGASGCYTQIELEDGAFKSLKVQDFEKNEDFMVVWDASKEERWTRDARSVNSIRRMPKDVSSKKQRFNELIQEAAKLSKEGSICIESFNIAYDALNEALKKCAMINNSLKGFKESYSSLDLDKENIESNVMLDISVLDPQVSITKGAPKRIKSGIEKRSKRRCTTKRKEDHLKTRFGH